MKHLTYVFVLAIAIFSTSCGSKNEHDGHDHSDAETTSPNDALYDEVMKIHDEVMPKMNDIYKMKEELKKQIADSPNMIEEKRKEIEAKIANLEAASEDMMRWMRAFSPPADSLGEETVREYLEGEMEKVKKVKESINEVLETGSSNEEHSTIKVDVEKIAGKTEDEVGMILGKGLLVGNVNPSKTNCPCPKIKYQDGKIEIVFINKKADWITINTNPSSMILGNRSSFVSIDQFSDYTFVKVFTK